MGLFDGKAKADAWLERRDELIEWADRVERHQQGRPYEAVYVDAAHDRVARHLWCKPIRTWGSGR